MATFIQGVTDTNLDPVLFTPDYSFLRYALGKKTAQYEQGLKSVSASYAAMKKELTDPVNIELRENYLKSAESQLQQIAGSDLSIQQNVNAANAIFDPIATNPAIAFDGYYTAKNKRELSQMESWAQSEDPAERKKFNKLVYDWVKRDLEVIKNGKGDVNNYKVQGRKSWAYIDPQDIINNAAKEQGFEVKRDELGNPYIVSTKGGETFRPSYENFARSVLQANPLYQQQKRILGEARQESDLDYIMSNPAYAGMSKTDAYRLLVNQNFTQGRDVEKSYVKGLNDRLAENTAEYKAYYTKNSTAIAGNPAGIEATTARQMAAQLLQFKNHVDEASKDYETKYGLDNTSFENKKKIFADNFLNDPKAYYSNQYDKENMIMFSNIRSSFGTREIKPDQAYLGVLAANNRALTLLANTVDDLFDNEIDAEELNLKALGLTLKPKGKGSPTGTSTVTGKLNPDGTPAQPQIEYLGTSATQVNTTQKLNQLKEKLEINKSKAMDAVTSTYGGFYLLERMGANQQDVSLMRGFFSRKSNDDKASMTKDEQEAAKRTYQIMWAWAKQNPDANKDFIESLKSTGGKFYKDIDYAQLLKIASKNYVPTDDNDYQAKLNLAMYENYTQETKRLAGLLNKGVDVVINQVKDDKAFSNLLVSENGKTRLMEANDLYKKIPSTGWREEINFGIDPSVKLSDEDKKDIAEGIFDGRIKVEHRGKISSSSVDNLSMFNTYGTFIEYKGRKLYLEDNFQAIPFTTDELQKNLKKINELIPIPILESSVPGVAVTGSSGFILRGNALDDIRVKLAAGATQENSNILQSDGSGKIDGYTDLASSEQGEVRNALASKENVEQMHLWTSSPLNSGSQLIEVVMASKSGENAPSWSGKRYYFPINVSSTKNEVFKIFAQADELDEFMTFSKKNEPYKIDYFEGSGVKVNIFSDQPGSKTGRVILESKYDYDNKTFVDNWVKREITFDLSKITFAELKQEIINGFITPYMQSYMNYMKQAKNTQGASGGSILQELQNIVTW